MPTFILHIFPDSGLASSLITTVWIGVFVVCFFNLRFGWNLSGLIVPGYLVPLMILKPWSAVAIIIEAVFTYFLIMFFSEFSSRIGRWSSLFGRDRFFAIILFSVISRLLFDTIVFPALTVLLGKHLHITFVYNGGLYSIGLIIVALIANQFWNPGIKRGFPQFLITLFISFLIIRLVLLEYTNFRISEIAYLYEDLATSLAASPKAYIVLIVTALLASRMNLLYGWEFGGIVLPALLALQWYYPWKIVSSILEAGIIYGLAVVILKTPLFRNITIEGARKILLFFNIAFAYKMLVGFLLPLFIPNVQMLDVYGLGYMLTSLVAIKMYDKKIGLKMTRTILQTSLLAVILATIIGFALLYIPSFHSTDDKDTKNAVSHSKHKNYTKISDAVLREQIRLYGYLRYKSTPTPIQLKSFKNAITALKKYSLDNSKLYLEYATEQLDYLDYALNVVNDKYIILYEKSWKRSRGIYVITLNPQKNTLIKIPVPTQGPGLIESALLTVVQQKFAALAIAGGKNSQPDQLHDYLVKDKSFFNVFSKVFRSKPTLQFFLQDDYIKTLLPKYNISKGGKSKSISNKTNCVYYSKKMSDHNLEATLALFPKLEIIKEKPSFVEYNKDVVNIFLTTKTITNCLNNNFDLKIPQHSYKTNLTSLFSPKKSFFSSIINLFNSKPSKKVEKRKGKNVPLTVEKALFLDTHVITPIINLTKEYSKLTSKERRDKLKLILFAARIANCTISTLTLPTFGCNYIVFSGIRNKKNKYLGGTFVFNTGEYKPYIIETLNPSDINNIKLGVLLSIYFKAHAHFVSGSYLPSSFFSYVDDIPTQRSLFNLVNQIMMRETDTPTARLRSKNYKSTVIQLSTISDSIVAKEDMPVTPNTVYFSTYYGKYKVFQLSKQEKNIYDFLKECDFNILFDNASPQTAGLAAVHSLQSHYIPETEKTEFVLLWLTPKTSIKKNTFKKIESEFKAKLVAERLKAAGNVYTDSKYNVEKHLNIRRKNTGKQTTTKLNKNIPN